MFAIHNFDDNHCNNGAYQYQNEAQRELVRHGAPNETAQHFVGATKLRIKLADCRINILHLFCLRVQLLSCLCAHDLQQHRQFNGITKMWLGRTVVSSINFALRVSDAMESAWACFASLR